MTINKNLLVGFGTYRLYNDQKKNLELLEIAISSGYRIFDTAQSYKSEKVLGIAIENAIKNKNFKRTDFKIISKLSPDNLSYENTIKSTLQSIKDLKTYIDYHLIHVPNAQVPLEETFKALKKLKEKKVIKNYGVSNFSLKLLEKSLKYDISAVQEEYSLIFLHNLKQLKLAKKNNVLFFSYMPLSNKYLLTGKNLQNFEELIKKYNKTAAQIALKWVQQSGSIPIVGTKSKIHLKENIDLDFRLSKEDFLQLAKKKWNHMD